MKFLEFTSTTSNTRVLVNLRHLVSIHEDDGENPTYVRTIVGLVNVAEDYDTAVGLLRTALELR